MAQSDAFIFTKNSLKCDFFLNWKSPSKYRKIFQVIIGPQQITNAAIIIITVYFMFADLKFILSNFVWAPYYGEFSMLTFPIFYSI